MNRCPNCGMETDGNFCPECGSKTLPVMQAAPVEPAPQPQAVPQPQINPIPNPVYTAPQPTPVRSQAETIPSKYKPITAWGYVGYSLLFGLPIAGFILAIVFSFNEDNINRRNYARAYFCGLLLAVIIIAAVLLIIYLTGTSIVNMINNYGRRW